MGGVVIFFKMHPILEMCENTYYAYIALTRRVRVKVYDDFRKFTRHYRRIANEAFSQLQRYDTAYEARKSSATLTTHPRTVHSSAIMTFMTADDVR